MAPPNDPIYAQMRDHLRPPPPAVSCLAPLERCLLKPLVACWMGEEGRAEGQRAAKGNGAELV